MDFIPLTLTYFLNSDRLPLPHKVKVGFRGSVEILDLLEEAESLVEGRAGSKKKAELTLKGATDSFVKDIMWGAILKRISVLSRSPRPSVDADKGKRQATGSLSVSSILGFDLMFTLRFDGRKLAGLINQKDEKFGEERESGAVARQVRRRLAGAILLWLASRWSCEIPRIRRLITLLRDGDLLEKHDADQIFGFCRRRTPFSWTTQRKWIG